MKLFLPLSLLHLMDWFTLFLFLITRKKVTRPVRTSKFPRVLLSPEVLVTATNRTSRDQVLYVSIYIQQNTYIPLWKRKKPLSKDWAWFGCPPAAQAHANTSTFFHQLSSDFYFGTEKKKKKADEYLVSSAAAYVTLIKTEDSVAILEERN